MTYNEKYDRYIDNNFNVYYWDKNKDKLMPCKLHKSKKGYVQLRTKYSTTTKFHRLIWETFVGEIPEDYQIDHIDTNKGNNSLENLRCVTPKENTNNPLTRKHHRETCKEKINSDFGIKFKEYYGITKCENAKLYRKEYKWYHRHNNKCRWEK